ncbi:hypothetical protein SPRG_03000 [Saprolegnia parasitica CBS 223.65]|uniref:Formin-homology 2 domain-containing protein n=1 Tax=Saprolegnia parasitica (strain CBS 223.65) TaxID=695850 RepID=A0A067CPS6_SAPPC|nr:hypothetical protein SPRG_03000 [Saprolegnia parasitica CBS 223.65]KDO32523.1 hypothetical protein SPRG_03000 [Saprolegnia parasitica CBS 223.65]|eukprot:XP_012196972.1 hypothetical protein SPRG_03000 [Saprolegnia parasitica CBS 223.65]
MNQLRRLASYVVDSSQHLKPTLKHMEPSYKHLDLTYVSPRVLVGGRPVDGPTDKKACVNNAVELKMYLEDEHANRYLIFNLCDDEVAAISPQTLEFSWERDGGLRTYTPPSDHIFRICYAIFAWLALDPENVAVIYCHNGKTRSGVVVACYFLFSRLVDDPMTALAQFYQKRLGIETLTPDYVRRSMPVSIQRFVTNFGSIMEHQAIPNPDPLLLKAIMFRALPVELQPLIQIWDDWHLIFSNAKDAVSDHVPPVVDWNPEDGFLAILWDGGIPLDGGFSILCSFGDDGDAEMDATSRVLFRYMDSTWFLSPGLVTLKKANLDMMKQYEHGFEDENFSVDMVFHNSNVPPRLIVPVDYTGNYAVKQGIVEIAAKHAVAPDPSMYLNFVKTGFDATASTYALQRAQNAPNLALDILHSEALTTIFTRLPPSPTSRDESLSQPVHEDSIKPSSLFASSTPHKASHSEAHRRASSSSSSSTSPRAETLVVTPPKGFSVPRATEPSPSSRRSSASSSYHDAEPDGDSVCVLCHEEDYVLRPQLVRCCGCQKCFHTSCAGLKKVPFGLTTMSDRTNHAAYMKKFFHGWRCTACAAASSPSRAPTTGGFLTEPKSPNHDKYEQLKELLSAKGISMDDLLRAADANLVKPPSDGHDRTTNDALDVTDKYKRMVDMGVPLAAAQNGMLRDGLDPALLYGYTAPPVVAPAAALAEPVLMLRDAIQFEGYFTMLSKGISKDAVKHKMRMCGLNPKILDLDPKASYLEVKSQIEALQAEVIYPSGSPPKPSSAKSPPKSAPATFVVPDKASTDSSTSTATSATTTMVAPAAAVDAPAALPPSKETAEAPNPAAAASEQQPAASDGPLRLRDDATYGKYFKMLKMNIPEGAVRQKMIEHGVNVKALELGPDGCVDDLDAPPAKVLLKDDATYGKYFKMLKMNIPEGAVRQKMLEHGVNPKALELGPDASVDDLNAPPPKVLLKDDPTYAKYFKMLKMNIPEGAVRQKMIEHGVNIKALDLGPDGCVDDLVVKVLLKDDPTYAKYFKMLKMNIPEGAVRQKMLEHGVNPRALELGPDAYVSQLDANNNTSDAPPPAPKKPARRKKLFWQPIPDDRLKSGHQSTIWEAKGDDEIQLEMDMDEIESLFFAKADSKTKKAAAKPLARKQAVTLVDGKRAMNAAIALARIKLTYAQVAAAIGSLDACGLTLEQLVTINEYLPTDDEVNVVTRYAGDPTALGEAEKFFAAIATVPRYSLKMECLITKSSFQTRVAEIDASVTNVTRACDDVKGSRLLKLLLGMVLKLGNTLNGGEETEHAIRGFSVDSLLRLGITKTVDNKTTVLHYLVRVIKKNQPLVLDFAKELEHVPLAAREATEAIDQALSSLSSSVQKLADERDRVKTEGVESLLATYEASVAATEADLRRLRSGVDHMKAQIAAVLDYFGEDPAKKPADFFQTLSSFCQAFEKAKTEVQTADDAKQRADRLLHRRTSSSIDMTIPSRLLEEKAAGMRQKAMTFRTKSTSLTDL